MEKLPYLEVTPGNFVASTSLMAKRLRTLLTRAALATLVCGIIGISAPAQNVDGSANSTVKGAYYVRQVLLSGLDQTTSAVGRARSIIGTMTFDGNGNYTFTGQMADTQNGSTAAAYSAKGSYNVGANGLANIQSPIDNTDVEYGAVGAVGPSAIVASATEGQYDDIFVAIPAGSNVTNATLNGSYRTGFIDFLQGNASQVRDGYYTLTSSGSGSFGNVTVTGAMENQNSTNTTQVLSGVTYSAASGGFTFNFPTSSTPLTQLVSGPKSMYISSDGNMLLGGSLNGFDMIVGIKAASGVTNSQFQGTYYTAALENSASDIANGNNTVDSYYGSILALGQGTTIFHLRLVYFNSSAFDYTADGVPYNFAPDGTFNDGFYENLLGVNGQAILQVGTGTTYSLTVGIQAKQSSGTGVFIDPLKIWNAASFAPITNSVAPGEFVSIFGSGLSSATLSAQTLPLPTNGGLGGVQVKVNGRYAALSYVSPTQINLLIPYATGPINNEFYVTLQVFNNGVASNQVTVYANYTAPGVFALTSNGGTFPAGVGPAAVLHADYSLVTKSSPAKAGETLQLYVTGLGSVTPTVADGAAAGSTLSKVDASVAVFVDSQPATVSFSGLAPGFAGLYQINFVVPTGVTAGTLVYVDVSTPDGYNSEAKLYTQ